MSWIRVQMLWVIVAVGLLAGCRGNQHEQLADKMISAMDDFATTLGSIQDEDSAKAAVSKLEQLINTMDSLAKQGQNMGEPAEPLKAKLETKLREQQQRMMLKMGEFMAATMKDPRIVPIIEPVFEKLEKLK